MASLLSKLWAVTSWDEYHDEWASSVGPFKELSAYQESLGFADPEDFFTKQAVAAQNLANDRIGDILERVYSTADLTAPVRKQLKKFTYQAIDFIRANDLIIVEDVRQQQTTINNQRLDSSSVNIDRVEGLVGAAAWRSFTLAGLEKLYISWAETQGIPYLLDPTRFYNKEEVDYKLSLIDDQIQQQQTLIDEKLAEFNQQMETKLANFRTGLNDDPDLIANIGDNLTANDDFIHKTAQQIDSSLVDKGYVDEQLAKKADKTVLASLETKTNHVSDINAIKSSLSFNNGSFDNLRSIALNDDGKYRLVNNGETRILTNVADPKDSLDAVNKRYVDNATTTIKTAASDLTKRVDTIKSGIEKIFFHEIDVSENNEFSYYYDVFLEGDGYYLLDISVTTAGWDHTYSHNASGGAFLVRVQSGHLLYYTRWTPGTTNHNTPEKWYILFQEFYTYGSRLGFETFKYIDGSTMKNPVQPYTLRILAKKVSGLPAAAKVEIYEQKVEKDEPVKEEIESER